MSGLRGLAASVTLAAFAVGGSAAAVEVGLRVFWPESPRYYVLAPNQILTGSPLTELMRGVEGEAVFRTNSLGIRGAELAPDGSEYRILAFGGSTSHNVYLDQSEAWTQEVGQLLGPTADGRETWSGSVGRSGATLRTNVVQFKYLVPSLPRIDAAVFLVGVNDLGAALRQAWDYRTPAPIGDPAAERAQMSQAFVRVPGGLRDQFTGYAPGDVPGYKRLALWHLARLGRDGWVARTGGERQDAFGWTLVTWRAHRRESPLVHDSLPPLEAPLREYRGYLESVIDMAREYGVRPIFMTQPVLWRSDLSPEEEAVLWMGGTGDFQNVPGLAYFAPGPLAEGMRIYNALLLDVCREREVECVDLAAAVPADTSMFYDDVHPTEAGSRLFAQTLAAHLRERPPYR